MLKFLSDLPAAIGIDTYADAANLISTIRLNGLNNGGRISRRPVKGGLGIRRQDGIIIINRLLHRLNLSFLLHDLKLVHLDLLRRHGITIACILTVSIHTHNSGRARVRIHNQ